MATGESGQKSIDRPSMKYLYRNQVIKGIASACKNRKSAWRQLGFELSLNPDDLNIIQQNHEKCVESCCGAVLEKWLERQPHASWEKLKEALKDAELDHLAQIVDGCTAAANIETDSLVISKEEFQSYGNDVGNAFLQLQARMTSLLKNANCGHLIRACIARANNPSDSGVIELSKELKEKILGAESTDSLFNLLVDSPYFRWIDIRLLEAMVTVSGNPQARELLNNYKSVIFSKPLLDVLPNVPSKEVKEKYYAKVVAKAEKDKTIAKANKDMTVGDLTNFQSPLMKVVIMDINKGICDLWHLGNV